MKYYQTEFSVFKTIDVNSSTLFRHIWKPLNIRFRFFHSRGIRTNRNERVSKWMKIGIVKRHLLHRRWPSSRDATIVLTCSAMNDEKLGTNRRDTAAWYEGRKLWDGVSSARTLRNYIISIISGFWTARKEKSPDFWRSSYRLKLSPREIITLLAIISLSSFISWKKICLSIFLFFSFIKYKE